MSSSSSSVVAETSRLWRRIWSISLCFRMPTSQVLSCDWPAKACGLASAASTVSETASSAQAVVAQLGAGEAQQLRAQGLHGCGKVDHRLISS